MTPMEGFGVGVGFVGAFALLGSIWNRMTLAKVLAAPFVKTGDAAGKGMEVAGKKGAISVEGKAVCDKVAAAPLSGTDCLYYEYAVTAKWKEKSFDSEGKEQSEEKEKSISAGSDQ